MSDAGRIDSLLKGALTQARRDLCLADAVMGLNWSLVGIAGQGTSQLLSTGMCFSPVGVSRQIPWAGTLRGRAVKDVAPWLSQWQGPELACALATVNAVSSYENRLLNEAVILKPTHQVPSNLTPFEYFAPRLQGARVVVIGRYPGMERFRPGSEAAYSHTFDYQCIERNPSGDDYPAEAAAFLLPQADWVFITASSLANKTLPGLLSLSRHAQVVLMGPSMPWLLQWADFGVNYLAGIRVDDAALLRTVTAEGGGTRIFDQAVRYCIAAL